MNSSNNITSNEYINLSEVTEKKFPEGYNLSTAQCFALGAAWELAQRSGQLFDALKKNIIYGAEFKAPTWYAHIIEAAEAAGVSWADKTDAALTQFEIEMLHMLIGMITEPAEALDAFMNYLTAEREGGENLDEINLAEEIGDLQWYCAGALRLLNTTFEKVMEQNINKLRARYGDKFSEYRALNRDLDAERKILESS